MHINQNEALPAMLVVGQRRPSRPRLHSYALTRLSRLLSGLGIRYARYGCIGQVLVLKPLRTRREP